MRSPRERTGFVEWGWPALEIRRASGTTVKEYADFRDIEPVTLPPGTRIYRVIDEKNKVAGVWWTTELPANKTAWRREYAVKDSWNDNGCYVEYVVPEGGLKAWGGKGWMKCIRYDDVTGKRAWRVR